ncbi:uncharacterized protein FIBRA_03899 [Fibroporia radiculosa]|uniref:Class E vacuolar protein-sorting machinery protein HSE1 n=1 Tax=Fibroporia radiculosa TaxID=599839 RepID=J4I9V7_9APHY|nr:uncharacterized protein FIBRA_03899 [Fibroporia radiculosa]CCM01831.1 predicted protein [Fibroporia radiculosa]
MFKGGQTNPYDDVVAKTTDENMTSENWELILNLCDKVQDEGETGARNVVAAVLKRLAHRNPNVQLYTFTLAESLTKNCGVEVHREIASRAFTQSIEKLVTDRNTHEKVRRRALALVAMWTVDFEKDPTLGIMEECYESLKAKGYRFETPDEPPPPEVDDEVRRREEEELQRALEMSMHDKGGRSQWEQYSLASSSGAGGSGAASSSATQQAAAASAASAQRQQSISQPTYGGYVPSSNPAVSANPTPSTMISAASTVSSTTSPSPSVSTQETIPVVTRVKALHTFEPTEAGELAFEKGDIIKVVDRGYKDWWRGQLKGRTGIFPVNYVEPLPEPTASEIAKEAEQEATVFSQAANVDRLLTLLRGMDPAKDNLADNEEIQELYRNCMTLRPKIVKLIDKYSQKRADLVSMNETFVKARTIFDRMMEESLARHTAMYDGRPPYGQVPSQSYIARPDSRARQEYGVPGRPQQYGWNPAVYDQATAGYNGYTTPPAAYPPGPEGAYPGTAQPQPYAESNPYAQRPQYAQPSGYTLPAGAPVPYGAQPEVQPYVAQSTHQPHLQPQYQPQPQPQPQPQQQFPAQAQTQVQVQAQQQQPQAMAHHPEPQPQPQPQVQSQPHAQPQLQPQPQSQPQPQPQQQTQMSGPPFVFDPNAAYPDPNAQAWAQYYAQGGTDPTGSVYFISVPGIKEGPPEPAAHSNSPDQAQRSPQQGPLQGQMQTQVQPQAGGYQPQGVQVQAQPSSSPYQSYPAAAAQMPQLSNPDLSVHPFQDGMGSASASEVHLPQQSAPAPSSPTASAHSHSHSQQQQQPGYGPSPYAAPGYAASAGAPRGTSPPAGADPSAATQQGAWPMQYHEIQTQFAGMELSGEGAQSAHASSQGVGAPA